MLNLHSHARAAPLPRPRLEALTGYAAGAGFRRAVGDAAAAAARDELHALGLRPNRRGRVRWPV